MKSFFANQYKNFIEQQGFSCIVEATPLQYRALMIQPRAILILVVAGTVFQSMPVFVAISALLYFSAAFPHLNPFERVFNRFKRADVPALTPAPAPRRFAQFLAGTFAYVIA